MTKILAYTSPSLGHLFPVIPILVELSANGYEVAVRTRSDRVRDVEALGLRASPIASDVMAIPFDDWKAPTPSEAQERAMRAFGGRAALDGADLRTAMTLESPDVLLIDIMAFGAMAEAEACGLPWAAWVPYPVWLRSPGIPPYGPGLAPLGGSAGRARDEAVAQMVAAPGDQLVAAVNAGRSAADLTPITEPDDVLLRPPLLLVLTAEPFEYARPWPPSFRLIGPCSWDPPGPAPAWLDADRRPVVLVTTSTDFQDDGRLVDVALEALADREDLLVVASVPAESVARFTCPPNAHVEGFIPHGPLLERAVAVVCHAGMGITQKALAAGVPVCAVPFGRDQLEVARRVEVSESGVFLPAHQLSIDSLRSAVERTISCRAGAVRVAAAFAASGGPAAAFAAIEDLVAAPSHYPA